MRLFHVGLCILSFIATLLLCLMGFWMDAAIVAVSFAAAVGFLINFILEGDEQCRR